MTSSDGLQVLVDGTATSVVAPAERAPFNPAVVPAPVRLWVVAEEDVLHAEEFCAFGDVRENRRIKHSNLTGGGPAYSGGELMMLDNDTLIVCGDSGRYGPRSALEMYDAAVAFRQSGYTVYSMGFDDGTDKPLPMFGGTKPMLI